MNRLTPSKSCSMVPCACGLTQEQYSPDAGSIRRVFYYCSFTIAPGFVHLVSGLRRCAVMQSTPTVERVNLGRPVFTVVRQGIAKEGEWLT